MGHRKQTLTLPKHVQLFLGYLGPSWVQIGSKSTEIDLKMAVWRLSQSFSTQNVQQVAQNGRGVDINPTHAQFGGRRTFLAVSGPCLCPYLGQTPRGRPYLDQNRALR